MTDPPTLEEIARQMENIKPPRFDRVVTRDVRIFDYLKPNSPPPSYVNGLAPAVFGLPVHTDEKLDVGVIELRMGDEVVERIQLGGGHVG